MKKLKKQTSRKEDFGRLLLDLGKLIFAGIVIGGVLRMDFQQDILLLAGSAIAFVALIIGLNLIVKEIKPKKPAFRSKKRRKR